MDHRRPIFLTIADAERMYAQMLAGVARTADWLRNLTSGSMTLPKSLRTLSQTKRTPGVRRTVRLA
jgi:hypothetical protein